MQTRVPQQKKKNQSNADDTEGQNGTVSFKPPPLQFKNAEPRQEHEHEQQEAPKGVGHKNSVRFSEDEQWKQVLAGKLLLTIGSNGLHVRKVQQGLVDSGHLAPNKVTGTYDADTFSAVKSFQLAQGLSGGYIDGKIGSQTATLLDGHFSTYTPENALAASFDPAKPTEGTRSLDVEDKNGVADIMSTEVKANPKTGKLPTFQNSILGKGTYNDRILDTTERVIIAQYNAFGKGKAKERTDPKNLHSWSSLENVAVESKNETDKVFGKYKKGAPLKAKINLKDGWEDKEKKLAASSSLRDSSADWRVRKIIQGHRLIRAIDQEHKAVQSRAAEKAILDKIKTKLVKKHRAKLIETHKGWPGYASGGKIFLQRYKSSTCAANRDYMWTKFRTIIHEYLHTLEHPNSKNYSHSLGEKKGGKTIREGFVDYFTKTVWAKVKFNDIGLRARVEGSFHDKTDPLSHPIPKMGAYKESENAERLAGLVGFKNLAASFFLGKTDLIGKP